MWTRIAHTIIKYRFFFILGLLGITAVMVYKAKELRVTYQFAKVVPEDDPDLAAFEKFTATFGEDANVMVIGVKDSTLYRQDNFLAWTRLSQSLDSLDGVRGVVGLPNLSYLEADHDSSRFVLQRLFPTPPQTQETLDSALAFARTLGLYQGLVFNKGGATVLILSINSEIFNSDQRSELVGDMLRQTEAFETTTGIDAHLAGLPYVRSVMSGTVQKELSLFLYLSMGITALILLVFFRSVLSMLVPLLIIGMSVVWSMGTIVLFDYKITLLTGLIPPILVVIGIPNSVYLINKYHQEYARHNNKMRALSTVIRRIGMVTLITNFTTAIGFLAIVSSDITILREFGVVAGINILATFMISLILFPAIYAYLPSPTTRQLKHLHFVGLKKLISWLNFVIQERRRVVYGVTVVVVLAAGYGSWITKSNSYMVDDLPESSTVKKDLRFMEAEFGGVMPLEIVIDTREKNGPTKLSNLKKLDAFLWHLDTVPELGEPLSMVRFLYAGKQAYFNNAAPFYSLPTQQDRGRILTYLDNSEGVDRLGSNMIFLDTTGKVRISLKVADVGAKRMDTLIYQEIIPVAKELFQNKKLTEDEKMPFAVTGTTPLFIKGNQFLIQNLRQSLLIAFILIAIIMAILFWSVRMVLISIVPNLIPLLITGAVMGYLGISLKPSTALIFTISFGIAVDDAIHFLARYRQQLVADPTDIKRAVSISIRETGTSMMYTSIVLFAGFIIFAFSDFVGTRMLGILTSSTLLCAMVTNLVLLPCLLIDFDSRKRAMRRHPLIEKYNEGNYEEDEDTDHSQLNLPPQPRS